MWSGFRSRGSGERRQQQAGRFRHRLLDGAMINLVNTDPPYNVCLMYSVAA